MPQTRIDSAVASDLTTAIEDYSVDKISTDAALDQKETKWQNNNWEQQLGYYKKIPELRAAIDAKATWTVGKGFEADPSTEAIIELIKGFGKDTFNTILENMIRTMQIGGDSYAEVIRDEEGDIINIKPLNPQSMIIVANRQGKIIRYEQSTRSTNINKKYDPIDIFHLSRNRVADEIHGVSLIDAIEDIILMRNEAMADMKEVFHRFVKPKYIFHLDTDDPTEIAAFKAKNDAATGAGENIYVPKDVVIPEQMAVAPNSTLNPLPWINQLNNYFFQAAGVPQIIVGGSQEFTEATAKIAYLAFQQTIEEDQLYIEEQVREQLFIKIELEFPASLENELLSDKKKDGAENIQPNETTAGSGQ